jgi:hypothetical protein
MIEWDLHDTRPSRVMIIKRFRVCSWGRIKRQVEYGKLARELGIKAIWRGCHGWADGRA